MEKSTLEYPPPKTKTIVKARLTNLSSSKVMVGVSYEKLRVNRFKNPPQNNFLGLRIVRYFCIPGKFVHLPQLDVWCKKTLTRLAAYNFTVG